MEATHDHHARPVPRRQLPRHERRYWKIFQNWLADVARSATAWQRRTLIAFIAAAAAGLIYLNTPNATRSGDLARLVTAVAAIWVAALGLWLWAVARVRR